MDKHRRQKILTFHCLNHSLMWCEEPRKSGNNLLCHLNNYLKYFFQTITCFCRSSIADLNVIGDDQITSLNYVMSNYIFRTTLLLIFLCFQPFVLIAQFSIVSANSSLTSCPGKQSNYFYFLGERWGKMANLTIVYSKEAWCQSFLACYSFSLKCPIKCLKLRIKPGRSFLLILCRLHWIFY